MTHPTTPKTPTRAVRMHPLMLCGVIFAAIGLLFALLGGAFLLAGRAELPRLFTAEAWGENVPDELALPLIGLIFFSIGLLFLLMGGGMLLVVRRQRAKREELERYGTRVVGAVADIVIDRAYRVNGRSPLRILVSVRHPVTGEDVTVRSGPVWETALTTGDPVDVLFDPLNEKRHVVVLHE